MVAMLSAVVAATALTIAVSPGNGGATRRAEATFNRRGGCEIARWNRVSFLFVTH
jgi:hypothetical protein